MSYADKLFIDMCSDIIENGYSTEGEKVRPKWPDGTYAYTIKKFGVVNRYDLSKEFPAITLRKTYIRSAIDEILWIWQKKSNNVHDLSSHIWIDWSLYQFFYDWNVTVIYMCICDDMYKLPWLKATYLCKHHEQCRILYHVPVICC